MFSVASTPLRVLTIALLLGLCLASNGQSNARPTATNDLYGTTANSTLVVNAASGVLANDVQPEQGTLRATLVSGASNGTLSLAEDGSFTYTPAPAFTGTDSFTYMAYLGERPGTRDRHPYEQSTSSVGSAAPNLATVSIAVTSADDIVILPLDEASGTVAGDVSGNNNDGALTNGAAFEAASGDGSPASVRFDGVDDYIDLGILDVDGTGLTLAAWFNADAFPGPSSDPRIISKASGQTANDHVFMLSTISSGGDMRLRSRLRVGGTTSTLVASSGNAQTGQWYHAAVTHDGTTVRLYLDGVEVGSQPLAGAIDLAPAVPVAVGDQPPPVGARPFDGLIDDVRILQRALSPAEIMAIVGDPPPNAPPVAAPDMYATGVDTPLNVNAVTGVLQNDTDADMDLLQAMLVNDVNDGALALNLEGSFTYTPDPAFTGTDSFTYYATDGTNSSNTVAVTIVVSVTANNPPIALPDQYATAIDAPLIVNVTNGVLKNDSDPDLDALDAVLVDDVTNGALSLSLDGSFSYTPNPAFEGVDGYTYFATDGTDNSDTVAVTITVTDADNAAPQIVSGVMVFTKDVIDNTVDGTHELVAGDLDGDTDTDLATTDYIGGQVYWYENDGNGGFTKRVLDGNLVGAYPAHIGDVDLDGDNDVLAGGYDSDTFAWYENMGGGNFTRRDIDTAALGAHSIVTVDLDEDGDIDLLTTNQDSHDVNWYENDGNENFTRRAIDALALNAKRAGFADLDNDDDLDVFAASNGSDQITWYENDGSENFTERLIDNTADGAYYVFEADVTGNGSPDILSASQLDHTIALYKNNGSGSFTTQIIDSNALGARTVAAADLDRDGDIDPMSASVNDDRLSWYENDGAGGFTKRTLDDNAAGGYAIRPYDMEPDGDIDVLGAYRDADAVVIHYQSRSHEAALSVAGGTLLIDASRLLTTDADDGPTELTYTITQTPLYGDVKRNGVVVAQGGTFTQADVNNGLITYTHDGSPALGDVFAFTVADGGEGGLQPVAADFFVSIPDVSAVAHYPLDETSGLIAPDIANNNDGTLVGGPTWLPSDGRVAGGLDFDGSDDRVDIGALDAVGSGLSIAAWFRAASFGNQGRFVSKATGTAEQDHYWMTGLVSNTALRFRLKAGGTTSTLVTAGNVVLLNEWYHVACTYDGSEMRIYLNGVVLASLAKSGVVDVNAAVQAALGNQPAGAGSNGFDGTLDDVRIYQRALSPAEVSLIANPVGGNPSSGTAVEKAPLEATNRPQLLAGSPNPFNPTTTIRYQLADATQVTIGVYDVRGSLVRTLVNARQTAGLRSVIWDGRDRRGSRVASGVYFIQLRTPNDHQVTKVTLIE